MQIDYEINRLFQQAVCANTNINKNKPKSLLRKAIPFIVVSAIFFAIGFVTHLFLANNTPKYSGNKISNYSRTKDVLFSKSEKKKFKDLVQKLAQKENQHPNKIHQELRNQFNYKSYHYLTKDLYEKIVIYLKERIG